MGFHGLKEVQDVTDEAQAVAQLMETLRSLGQDADDEVVESSITSETNFREAVDQILTRMLEEEARVEGIDAILDKLKKRQDRFKKRVERLSGGLAEALTSIGKSRLETTTGTVFLKRTPAKFEVTDESAVGSEYREWTINTKELKAAYINWTKQLEAINEIPDAEEREEALANHRLMEPGGGTVTEGRLKAEIRRA